MFQSVLAALFYSLANIMTNGVFQPARLEAFKEMPSAIASGPVAALALLLGRSLVALLLLFGAAGFLRPRVPAAAAGHGVRAELLSRAYGNEILLLFFSQLSMVVALSQSSPSVAVAAFFTYPLWVETFEHVSSRRRPEGLRVALGALLAVTLVLCAVAQLQATALPDRVVVAGLAWGLASGASFAAHLQAQSVNVRRSALTPLRRTTLGLACLSVLSLVAALGASSFFAHDVNLSGVTSPLVHIELLVAAAAFTVAAGLCTFFALRKTSASRYASLSAISPALTLGLEAVLSSKSTPPPPGVLGSTAAFTVVLVLFASIGKSESPAKSRKV